MRIKVQIKPKVKTVGSHRGGKIQIDKRLPKKDRPGIVIHEAKEKALMDKGDKYSTAHHKANIEEKKRVGGKQYTKEEHDSMSLYRKNLASSMKSKSSGGKVKCKICCKVNCRGHY